MIQSRSERKTGRVPKGTRPVFVRLPFQGPFDWKVIGGFLAARAIPGVESVFSEGYRRTVRIGASTGTIEVRPFTPTLLRARILLDRPAPRAAVTRRLRRIFDLDADPGAVARCLRTDPLLGPRLRRMPGIRVPGAWDGFEMAVRAILGQQVSVRGATTLAARLAARWGEALEGATAEGPGILFPTPAALTSADLTRIGVTRARSGAIRALAAAVTLGELDLDGDATPGTLDRLRALAGVGEWTAQYIAMRALRDPDGFPASDLGVRRALSRSGELPPVREVERLAEAWRPYRAYGVMLLWLG